MKVLNNSLKLKAISKNHLLLIVVVIIIAAVLNIQIVNHVQQQPKDDSTILQKKRFVMIKIEDPSEEHFEVGLDLEKKEYYYNDETAVKDDTVFGGYKADWDRKQYYNSAVNEELSSVLLSSKITMDEIKKSNYQITSSPKRFVDEKLMKEEYPPEFEAIYLKKIVNSPKSVSPTTKSFYLPKSNGTIRVKKG